MPFPGSRVIHPLFSARHRPVALGTMTATCSITRPVSGTGTLNPATGIGTPADPTLIIALTPCRVQNYRTAKDAQSGQQTVTQRDYLIALPYDSPLVKIDDRLVILSSVDPLMLARVFRVADVIYGSEEWQRDLHCIDDLG